MILSRANAKETLKLAILRLQEAGINSAILDAEVLLAFAIKKPKEYLYAHPEAKISHGQLRLFQNLIARRAKHEPVAYLTGHKEFFGLDFVVNHNVLIPRPETELMVEEALKIIKSDPLSLSHPTLARIASRKGEKLLIDIGTGSGCIPIAVVKNSGVRAIAIDSSATALTVAKKNAKMHKIMDSSRKRGATSLSGGLRFLLGDLLKPILNSKFQIPNSQFIVITANLPYLPTDEWRHTPVDVKKYEPREALDGGKDGLKYYWKLLPQIKNLAEITRTPIICLFEFCPEQKSELKKLVKECFLNPSSPPLRKGRINTAVKIKKDLAGRDRLLILQLTTDN